jgi:DNA-binding FadR family transcriptional regulator
MQPLLRKNLFEKAAEGLRTEIRNRRWSIGERLPNEATLSGMMSVSRGTVREAVRVLVSQGYLETRQGSGTFLRSYAEKPSIVEMATRSSLHDQLEALCALDVQGARLAALRQTPGMIAHLRSLLVSPGIANISHDIPSMEQDLSFHKAVIAASCNRAIIDLYAFLCTSVQLASRSTVDEVGFVPDMPAHVDIVDAIETGNPNLAEAVVRRHYRSL